MALVIGNAAYRSISTLPNAANDADDMCAALGRLGFETRCAKDIATRAEFMRIVRQFAGQLDAQAAAFFYYAGHGAQLGGRNYLLPTAIAPASSADLEAEGMPLDDVFASLKASRSVLNIVVLDACRDDPFASRQAIKISRGLAREEPPTGSVLVYSTAPGGVAADGRGRNGLFTAHLLSEIERPGPQVGELFHSVARLVDQEARRAYAIEQVPYRSFSYTGVFCLAGCDDAKLVEQAESLKQQRAAAAARIRELEQQNAALASARNGQSEVESTRRTQDERIEEIRTLRAQLNELAMKSNELETYRLRIAALEKENKDKERQLAEGAQKEEVKRSKPIVVPSF